MKGATTIISPHAKLQIIRIQRKRLIKRITFRHTTNKQGCIEPSFAVMSSGYTKIEISQGGCRFSIHTHRVAWILKHDRMPEFDILIRHQCDNKLCCNPDHLLSGTHQDNMQDMYK